MKLSITLSALLIAGFMAATTEPASAVVYCQYVDYPAGCIVRTRRRAAPAAGRARGGDARRRPCRHTHEPRRPGGSRRPALIGPFLLQ